MTVIDPGTLIPARSKTSGAMRWASVFISASPRLCERRRAGSIVRQRTRFPRRAAARPRAAVVVVFPTPPQPTQRMTRRVSRSGARPREETRDAEADPGTGTDADADTDTGTDA